MADEPDNMILALLRRMDVKLDRVIDNMRDFKVRVFSLEENTAVVSRRLDRVDDRLERIERRLDLVGEGVR